MNFFKKLFNSPKQKATESQNDSGTNNLCLDQIFVKEFLKKNNKFLYCASVEDVKSNLSKIIAENEWSTIICNDIDLTKFIDSQNISIINEYSNTFPMLVGCEHLIAENGSILFSSNQLKDYKISDLSEYFIVYATTSQLVNTKGEALTGINSRHKGNIPSNISAIKNYNPNSDVNDFMNYGNTNSKNLYLLLFEDL